MSDKRRTDSSLTEVGIRRIREPRPSLEIKRDPSGIIVVNDNRQSCDDYADWLLSQRGTVSSDIDLDDESLRTRIETHRITRDTQSAKMRNTRRVGLIRAPKSLSSRERYIDVATMQVRIKPRRHREALEIPFWTKIVKSGRILDDSTQKEWLDDAEQRLRSVISRIDPRPASYGYVVERDADGLTIQTVTGLKVAKHAVGQLSSGEWPCWNEIIEAVPEFDMTVVVFDAVSRREWSRRWDMRLQQHRIQLEHGIFA